ncbi:thioesterase family protein [Mesonia sp. K7]|uniref:acyl-CoA thioesterase n=1 Tax=Mesonia sp. K7 TaxID=2218606 RepID=UPI000DA96F60|nr:thioesterase family protein [Mesonia sp. K7]PZD76824.1 acyl-CoA thioesterase [Mesonia sp. K7]
MRRSKHVALTPLQSECKIRVRFKDCDPLQIVWHGNYLVYFEDGREAFNKKYGLDYSAIYEQEGFSLPIVQSFCEHQYSLKYGDTATVKVFLCENQAAKIHFKYEIYNQHEQLCCVGETIQVFVYKRNVDKQNELSLVIPEFYRSWQKKYQLC